MVRMRVPVLADLLADQGDAVAPIGRRAPDKETSYRDALNRIGVIVAEVT